MAEAVDEKDEFYVDFRTMENIRVISRFRPIGKHEAKEEKEQQYQDRPPVFLSPQQVALRRAGERAEREPIKFILDHQFPPTTTQKQLFGLVGLPMIEACLAGYNATIFAYGQTGSGKTYSMFGPETRQQARQMGLVPRSINYLFEQLNAMSDPARGTVQSYTVRIQFLQIYKEKLLDLLDPNKALAVKIKWDPINNCPIIPNALSNTITSIAEVLTLLHQANSNRKVASHKLNAHSSRSHMLVMLQVVQHVKTEDGDIVVRRSKLNFGDLAGSEDVKKALGDRPDPERLAEAKKINLSLSMLTQAINFLSKKQKPSYRSSVLTYALQDSLGGNSKTTMLVALSPHFMNRTETIRSLRFAVTAKQIKNKAKRNEELTPAQLKKRIQELLAENAQLKTQILALMNLLRTNNIDFDPSLVAGFMAEQRRASRAPRAGATPQVSMTAGSSATTNGGPPSTNGGPHGTNGPDVVEPPEKRKLSIGGAGVTSKPQQRVEMSIEATSSVGHRASQAISKDEYDALITNLTSLTERYDAIIAENSELTEHLQSKDQELHHLTNELEELTALTSTSGEKMKELQNTNQTLERRVEEMRTQLVSQTKGSEKSQQAVEDQIRRLQRNYKMAKGQAQELEAQVHDMQLRLDHVTAEKDSLADQVQEFTSNPEVIRQISERQQSGRASDATGFDVGDMADATPADMLLRKFGVAPLLNDLRLTPEQRMVKTAKIMSDLSADMGSIIGKWHETNKVRSDRKQSEMVFQIRQLIGHFNLAMNKIKSQEVTFQNDLQFQLKRKDTEIRQLREQTKDILELRDDLIEKEEQIEELNKTVRHLQEEKEEFDILQQESVHREHNRDLSRELSYLRKVSQDSFLGEPTHFYKDTLGGSYDPVLDTLAEDDDVGSFSMSSPLRVRASTAVPNRPNIPQWRLDLREMDRVDALDKFDTWYPAVVVTIRNNDLIRIHYDGFSEKYDEWIERDSSRLAQFESRTATVGGRQSIAEMAPVDSRDGIHVYKTGFLTKEGKLFRTFRTRYFVLFGNKFLKYYKGIDSENEQGSIDLSDVTTVELINWDRDNVFGFELQTPTRTWRFQSGSEKEVLDWIEAIRIISKRQPPVGDDAHDI